MVGVLGDEHVREQAGSGFAARDRQRRCRRLVCVCRSGGASPPCGEGTVRAWNWRLQEPYDDEVPRGGAQAISRKAQAKLASVPTLADKRWPVAGPVAYRRINLQIILEPPTEDTSCSAPVRQSIVRSTADLRWGAGLEKLEDDRASVDSPHSAVRGPPRARPLNLLGQTASSYPPCYPYNHYR